MANSDIVTSAGKGAALTAGNHDQNMKSLAGIVEEITGAFTVDYQDQGKTIQCNSASTIAVTLGTAVSIIAAGDTDTFQITFKNINSGVVTITRSGAETIDGATAVALNNGDSVTLQTNDTNDNWNIVTRDMDVVDINGGTIDGVTVGGGSAVSLNGTNVTSTTQTAGNDSTKLATTAYADATRWTHLATFSSTGLTLGSNTSIPATALGIKFVINGISPTAGGIAYIELGDSGGYSTTIVGGAATTSGIEVAMVNKYHVTAGFSNASVYQGQVEFTKLDGVDKWVGSGLIMSDGILAGSNSAGTITLAGTLDRCRMTISVDGFDATGDNEVHVFTYS